MKHSRPISQILSACSQYLDAHPEIYSWPVPERQQKLLGVAMKSSEGRTPPEIVLRLLQWEFSDIFDII